MRRRKNRSPTVSIDPETGDLLESGRATASAAGEEPAPAAAQEPAPKRSGLLGAAKRAAADAVVRHTSSKH